MDYHEFVGEVQHRLGLPGTGEVVRATRAVLTTLGERIHEGEPSNLAGTLPMEIDYYLLDAESGQRFGFDEFVSRVAGRAGLGDHEEGRREAAYYAQAIVALLAEIVPGTEFEEAREGFPADEGYDELCELVGVAEAFEEGIEQTTEGPCFGHRHSRPVASRRLSLDRSRSTARP